MSYIVASLLTATMVFLLLMIGDTTARKILYYKRQRRISKSHVRGRA